MAQEQTAYAGDDIKVLVNVIDSTGSHVAATINTTTTRIDGNSAAPTVTTVATGIYQITFSGVTPAPTEGDRLTVKVNGDIGGTAWSEYGIPVKIVADERGTDNVVVPTSDITAIKTKTDQLAFSVANQVDSNALTGGLSQADVRAAVGLASANLDTQLADIPTVSEFEARTLIAAAYFDPTADTVTTDAASRIASQADVSSLATAASIAALNDFDPATEQVVASNMRGTDNANTVAPVDVSGDVTAIKAKTDQLAFSVANQVDANLLTGGSGPNLVTITVQDAANNSPVQNATVRLSRAGESASDNTDASGQVVLSVNAATFDVAIIASGFEGEAATLVVSGDQSETYQLTASSIPAATDPLLCTVVVDVSDQTGGAYSSAKVRARLSVPNITFANSRLIAYREADAATDTNGRAQITLIRQVTYEIRVFGDNHQYEFLYTVPDQSSAIATPNS